MEEWLIGMNIEPWFSTGAIFFAGISVGWLVFGGHANQATSDDVISAGDENSDLLILEGENKGGQKDFRIEPGINNRLFSERRDNLRPVAQGAAPDSMKIGALESELRKAYELIEASEEQGLDYLHQFSELEDSLKLANTKLKLVTRSVKKIRLD